MPDIDGAWLALIGTLFGGAGLKIIEAYLGNAKKRQDAGVSMRDELRQEIAGLRAEAEKAKREELRLEAEVEAWRKKYYDQFVLMANQTTELTLAKAQVASLMKQLDEMSKRIDELETIISNHNK